MKEVRGKLMALMKKHQMDITEFSEKCGIKEERVERLLGGRENPAIWSGCVSQKLLG